MKTNELIRIVSDSGEKYSYRFFKNYKMRGKIHITTHEGHTHHLDIYTTQTNRKKAEEFLQNQASEKVKHLKIFYWTTKEADDRVIEFIGKLNKVK